MTSTSGRSRPWRPPFRLLALTVALAAGAVLIGRAPVPVAGLPSYAGRVSLGEAWPEAVREELPAVLPDGAAWRPVLLLGDGAGIGVAATPDGRFTRLILRRDGRFQEVRRLSADGGSFAAFATDGDVVTWAETGADGSARLWLVPVLPVGAARLLSTDLGAATFAGTPYDLVISAGQVHWTAEAPGGRDTELRAVALTGGALEIRREPGRWSPGAWPWVTDRDGGLASTTLLRNVDTLREVRVASGGDLVTCDPVWCRAWVLPRRGPARLDLMRPDGSDRATINTAGADAATGEVALLDRFVVLTEPDPGAVTADAVSLLVHDIRTHRTVVVAKGVSEAYGSGNAFWWSAATGPDRRWTAIDLRLIA